MVVGAIPVFDSPHAYPPISWGDLYSGRFAPLIRSVFF